MKKLRLLAFAPVLALGALTPAVSAHASTQPALTRATLLSELQQLRSINRYAPMSRHLSNAAVTNIARQAGTYACADVGTYCISVASLYTDSAGNEFSTLAIATGPGRIGQPDLAAYACSEAYTSEDGDTHVKSAAVIGVSALGDISPSSRAGILWPYGSVDDTATNVESEMYPVQAVNPDLSTSVNVLGVMFNNNATSAVYRGGFGMAFYGQISDTDVSENETETFTGGLPCFVGGGFSAALAEYNGG